MADNAAFPAATVAADDVGGVLYQRVKISVGADGSAADASTSNPLPVNHATTSIGHGHKEVTTAGTDVALASSTAAKWVTLQAYRSNTGYIAIGATGVDASATAGTGTGLTLAAGEAVTFPIDDLADVYLDATVDGEGVRYTYGA